MGNPFLYFRNKQQVDERRNDAPKILMELSKNFGYDANTVNKILKDYVDSGEIKLPRTIPQDAQGPLAQDQIRETPTNQMRKPAYVYDEKSNQINPAPAGVDEPIKQIRELNRFRENPTPVQRDPNAPRGNWYKDESGQWQHWVAPERPKPVTPTRPAARTITPQERVDMETIKTLQNAQKESGAKGVPVSAEILQQGVEAAQRLGLPTYSKPVEEDVPGVMASLQRLIPGGKTGKQMGVEIGLGEGNGGAPASGPQTPVQPRKQDTQNENMSPEQYLRSINAKITPANVQWAKRKLGSK